MSKQYVMGNGAIALGALSAGVNLVSGYPGTPSSEIIETVAKFPHEGTYVEWSVNEKAAMEVASAAAYSGARAMVTMKQVGLNVASDPLMSLAYVGVKGGMVVVSADDPGPISSQTEQDTRRFAEFARIPVFDPASPEEAFEMVQDAFAYSEKYKTPVILRPTTRVDHAYASIDAPDTFTAKEYEGFVKDSKKWVIFPRLSFQNHAMIEKRNIGIGEDFSSYRFNTVSGSSEKAVIATGVSYAYASEFLKEYPDVRLIKVGTPYPTPESFLLKALEGVSEVLCFEELSPYIEETLLKLIGRHHLDITVRGKLTGDVPASGENDTDSARRVIGAFLGLDIAEDSVDLSGAPQPPMRPPVLCAGCPHRASFYAVKKAMKGKKSYFCGDIGCYTLGNAMPLDMVDTCLCMGAGITMAQGFNHIDPDATAFSFTGDSTFFASGITGVVNAVYNAADMIVCVLDNSTTAMTGHQPHPGTGRNLMQAPVDKISIEKILLAVGVKKVLTVDPLDLDAAVAAVNECAAVKGVKAIIFKSPCVAITKPNKKLKVDDEICIGCLRCIKEIGCPALSVSEGKVVIDGNLCTGCGLCSQLCPVKAIGGDC
ncbi:MAG: indolepyruvate ferredoxin oxidoreductase subunit alpha [Ruminococcus sp.]|uniref:indolepyruvate ferredoxin oxidoreductase subunit alpha n=1 Tax=Ruminococcus sp. TaxID=41978 RepID=UPI0028731F79|nr:indolepyruvate ferredoxin oxidoreductase subunit alpha [Ruminococcus sp.]MBQ3285864.1 indolepyruvate ferredoxin oxidoreductase subunit alpha [Ruminococcus sp.]